MNSATKPRPLRPLMTSAAVTLAFAVSWLLPLLAIPASAYATTVTSPARGESASSSARQAGAARETIHVSRGGQSAAVHAEPDQSSGVVGTTRPGGSYRVLDSRRMPDGRWLRIRLSPQATGWLPAAAGRVEQEEPNILVDCSRHRSRSYGTPGNGRVTGAVLFPLAGPDHFSWNFREQRIGGNDRTRWGNCRMVNALIRGLASYRRKHPEAPQAAVGDLGLRRGGDISHHSTHENGLVVDIYYPRRDRKRMEPHRPSQVDQRLSRALVREILRAGARKALVGGRVGIPTSSRVHYWPNHEDHAHFVF